RPARCRSCLIRPRTRWKICSARRTSGNGRDKGRAAGRRGHDPEYPEVPGMKKRATRRAASNRAAPAGGGPAPLVGLELDARRAQRVRPVEALRGGRTPLTLIAIADHGTEVAEGAVRQAVRADPPAPSACKEGCDWCCHLTVGTSVPEVVRVVEYLRQTLSPEEFAALRERVVRLDEQRRGRGGRRGGGAAAVRPAGQPPLRRLPGAAVDVPRFQLQRRLGVRALRRIARPDDRPALRPPTAGDGLRPGRDEGRAFGVRIDRGPG